MSGSDFYQKVYDLVRRVPQGRVATYGQIAALISSPRAARMVGSALRHLPQGSDVPWHRVINSKGFISIENLEYPAEDQANHLIVDGIEVHLVDGNYTVDLEKYLWRP